MFTLLVFGTHLLKGQQLDRSTAIARLQFSRLGGPNLSVDTSILTVSTCVGSIITLQIGFKLTTNEFLRFKPSLMSFHMANEGVL